MGNSKIKMREDTNCQKDSASLTTTRKKRRGLNFHAKNSSVTNLTKDQQLSSFELSLRSAEEGRLFPGCQHPLKQSWCTTGIGSSIFCLSLDVYIQSPPHPPSQVTVVLASTLLFHSDSGTMLDMITYW